jgi:hypothetical protein
MFNVCVILLIPISINKHLFLKSTTVATIKLIRISLKSLSAELKSHRSVCFVLIGTLKA